MSHHPRVSFNFHAEGHAFSAELQRPVAQHIDALAATSLPTIGGHGVAHRENFRAPGFVAFEYAHTHVSGSFGQRIDDPNHAHAVKAQNPGDAQAEKGTIIAVANTQATTSIEQFNLLDFITARRITARLSSEHIVIQEPDGSLRQNEGHIIALGSAFDDLRIGGYEVKVKLRHKALLDAKTHRDFVNVVASEEEKQKISQGKGGIYGCSLVEEIITDFPGVTEREKKRGVLHIPHFGTIVFAHVLSEEGTKTLTMLQILFGCPNEGSATTAQARTNGQTVPPIPT
jgi:hypothetical protein